MTTTYEAQKAKISRENHPFLFYGRRAAAFYGIALVSWLGIKGLNIDSQSQVNRQAQAVANDKKDIQYWDTKGVSKVKATISGKCLPLIEAYSDHQVLHHEGFNASVLDIANDPSRDCGDGTIKIGTELSAYQKTLGYISEDQRALQYDQHRLGVIEANADRNLGDILPLTALETLGLEAGLIFVGVVGAALLEDS